jgi:urease subunit gamma/beta
MHLTPTERDRLLLFSAAELARARRRRGLLLNVPETIAIVADTVAEAARDGARLAEAVERGRTVLRVDDVLPGVADVVRDVKVEAVFDDGTRLAVVPDPVGPAGSTLTSPGAVLPGAVLPGAVLPDAASPEQPPDDELVEVDVVNESSVPISVTSHFHFFEVNPRLRFDRRSAWGRRLAIPAGAVQRFDPGTRVTVPLRPFGGDRVLVGFAGLCDGPVDEPGARERALERARACGYLGAEEAS